MNRHGIAATTVIVVVAGALGIGASIFAISDLIELFNLIIDNTFFLVVEGIILMAGVGLLTLVIQDDISTQNALISGVVLIGGAVLIPIFASQLIGVTTTYTANIQVDTDQWSFAISNVKYNGVSVQSVKEGGPQIFNVDQACLVGCSDYTVDITVTCGNKVIRQVSVSGSAGDDKVKSVGGLPSGEQCVVRGDIVEPVTSVGKQSDTATFYTE